MKTQTELTTKLQETQEYARKITQYLADGIFDAIYDDSLPNDVQHALHLALNSMELALGSLHHTEKYIRTELERCNNIS